MDLGTHLKNELKERQARNPSFSMRSFAKWLGLSPAQLSQVISGKRKVTPKVLRTVSDRLGLSPIERIAFMNKTLSIDEGGTLPAHASLQLSEDQFRLISDWYHIAILSLIKTPGAKADPRWIGRRLGISVTQAQEALLRLTRLELIETSPQLKRTGQPLRLSSEFRSDAIRTYHKQNLGLAIEKLDLVPNALREVQAITMAIDPAKIPRAKKLIDDFLLQLEGLLESGKTSEVYTLSVQLFPLTQGDSK